MGSRFGKYDLQQNSSLRINQETLPSFLKESNQSKSKTYNLSFPRCVHRDLLIETFPVTMDNLSVVWLDTNIHARLSNIDTEVKLKNLINYVRIFDRVDACERYIKQIGKYNNNDYVRKERLLVIISTTLGPTLIPHLHDLSQVKYVYIFGKSKTISKSHQEWLGKYHKVRGVFTTSRSLITRIAQDLD